MNFELLKNVLIVAVGSSIITTTLVQKIKEGFKFKNSKNIIFSSFGVSMLIGTLFSLTFTDLNFVNSLWVGLISFIGADAVYKTFEDKIFKSFGTILEKESE
jgi:hypothetical protein